MAYPKIIEKLNNQLGKDIDDECQVVFILSRIRKIIDMGNSRNSYGLLNFYCDWALHNELDRNNTTKIISDMFDQDIDIGKNGKDIANDIKSAHPDFFKFEDLKKELKLFFKNNGVAGFFNQENWINFISLLLGVIEECPVICIKSLKIDRLELFKVENGNYCYKFSLKQPKNSPIIKLKFKKK